jgi:hypothetical protein
MPPAPKERSDKLSQDIIETIHAAAHVRCPTSPCMKDECRRRLSRGHWESARAIFRHESMNEYWAWFREKYPGTAARIASREHPEEAPRAFRDNQPWYLRDKGGDSCLCMSCEGMQKKMSAASRAAALLGGVIDRMTPNGEEADEAAAVVVVVGPLTAAALPHLKDMVRVLEAKSKGQMCLECTCGGTDAKLEDRNAACVSGLCESCGFSRCWSSGLRPLLVDHAEPPNGQGLAKDSLKEGLPPELYVKLHWSNYAYRSKKTEGKKKQGQSRGLLRAAAAAAESDADEDGGREPDTNCKELYVQAQSGTLIDFLDEFEPAVAKHVIHRSTLSRQKAGSLGFERDRRPGGLSLDIDFAENGALEEARKVQSEHWSTDSYTLFIAVAQFLDVAAWNLLEGELDVGAEVTVNGEMAGKKRAPDSYWARVVSNQVEDSCCVEDAEGVQRHVQRSLLRHRVFIKQCHAGVTGDKKHDRHELHTPPSAHHLNPCASNFLFFL